MASRFFEMDPEKAFLPIEPEQLEEIKKQIDIFFDAQRRFWEEDVKLPKDLDEDMEPIGTAVLGQRPIFTMPGFALPSLGNEDNETPIRPVAATSATAPPATSSSSQRSSSRRNDSRNEPRTDSRRDSRGGSRNQPRPESRPEPVATAQPAAHTEEKGRTQVVRRKPQPLAPRPTAPQSPLAGRLAPGRPGQNPPARTPSTPAEKAASERPGVPRPPTPPRPAAPGRSNRRGRNK